MTEPSKAAVEKWHSLIFGDADVSFEQMRKQMSSMMGGKEFARFIDHVSEAVGDALPWCQPGKCISVAQRERLASLILPDPEPDVLAEAGQAVGMAPHRIAALAQELAKRGGRIVFDGVQS